MSMMKSRCKGSREFRSTGPARIHDESVENSNRVWFNCTRRRRKLENGSAKDHRRDFRNVWADAGVGDAELKGLAENTATQNHLSDNLSPTSRCNSNVGNRQFLRTQGYGSRVGALIIGVLILASP